MRNPFHRRPVCPGCGKRHASVNPAIEAVVEAAVALVTSYPPGTFPRLQVAIMRAVEADEKAHGPAVPPPAKPEPVKSWQDPSATAAPVDPIDAEVAKFVRQLDEYPTAEEPKR